MGLKLARICIGTIEDDVHDIGKSICSTMFRCGWFDVVDLGGDVPPKEFVAQVGDNNAQCWACSCS